MIASETPADSRPSSAHRHLAAPGRLLVALLAVESLLWLSTWLPWPAWHKGYAVLVASAVVAAALLLMTLWFAVSLLFRLRFQFSLRSLQILVAVVALPCSWMATEIRAAKRQKETVQAMAGQGARAYYDYQCDDSGDLIPAARAGVSNWLLVLFDEDFFTKVVQARVDDDAGLEYVKRLPDIRRLLVGKEPCTRGSLLRLSSISAYCGREPPFPLRIAVKAVEFEDLFEGSGSDMERINRLPKDLQLYVCLTPSATRGMKRIVMRGKARSCLRLEIGGQEIQEASVLTERGEDEMVIEYSCIDEGLAQIEACDSFRGWTSAARRSRTSD